MQAFIIVLLIIEFLDEFTFGVREAAWPLIRSDLGLSYVQIGLLLSLPGLASGLIEPVLGILGDVWKRRVLVLGGGLAFALAWLLAAASENFGVLLLAFCLLYPASGAFVSLSQATLMDVDPARHEHNMARWTFAGSLGVVAGPLALGAAAALGLGWRGLFLAFVGLTLAVVAAAWRFRFDLGRPGPGGGNPPSEAPDPRTFKAGLVEAWRALQRGEVLRWLVLLQFADLMLDVLLGYLALYCVDVVGVTPAQASLAVAVWTGVGLLGDFLIIPLLERVPGLRYLRVSVALKLVLYPAFLLVPGWWVKLGLLGLLGLLNAGWYSILQAQLYSAMPGRSGTVMTLGTLFALLGSLIPLGLGAVAQQWGLETAMWLLLAGPLALLVGLAPAE